MNKPEVLNASETKEPKLNEVQEFELYEQFLAAKEYAVALKQRDAENLN